MLVNLIIHTGVFGEDRRWHLHDILYILSMVFSTLLLFWPSDFCSSCCRNKYLEARHKTDKKLFSINSWILASILFPGLNLKLLGPGLLYYLSNSFKYVTLFVLWAFAIRQTGRPMLLWKLLGLNSMFIWCLRSAARVLCPTVFVGVEGEEWLRSVLGRSM